MKQFTLTVASPDGELYRGEVLSVSLRGSEGDLAIMAGHIPFVTSVVRSKCTLWLEDGGKRSAQTEGGLLSVGSDGTTFISGTFSFDD